MTTSYSHPPLPPQAAPTRRPHNLPSSTPTQSHHDFEQVNVHIPTHTDTEPWSSSTASLSWWSPWSWAPAWLIPTWLSWQQHPEEVHDVNTLYQPNHSYSLFTPSPDLKQQQRSESPVENEKRGQQENVDAGLCVPSALQPFQRPWDILYDTLNSFDLNQRRWTVILGLLTFLSGGIDIVVTLMNVELVRAIGKTDYSALKAAFLAFAIGLGCVVLIIAVQPKSIFIDLPKAWRLRHKIKLWQLFGGFLGAVFIALAILVSAKQGVGSFFTCLIAGQQALAFFVESRGLFGLTQLPFNRWKLAGFVLLIIGQLFFQDYTQHVPPGDEAAFIFAGLAAGCCQLLASNINLTLSNTVESYLIAQLISASISTALLSVPFGLAFIAEPYTFPVSSEHYYKWWMWLGGVLGETVITMTTILPVLFGNSRFSIFNISGQLVLAAIATTTNFLDGGSTYPAQLMIIAGVVLGCLGAGIISLENQRLEKRMQAEKDEEM